MRFVNGFQRFMSSIKQTILDSSYCVRRDNNNLNLTSNDVVIYIRASTKEQGVDAQNSYVRNFALRIDYISLILLLKSARPIRMISNYYLKK